MAENAENLIRKTEKYDQFYDVEHELGRYKTISYVTSLFRTQLFSICTFLVVKLNLLQIHRGSRRIQV